MTLSFLSVCPCVVCAYVCVVCLHVCGVCVCVCLCVCTGSHWTYWQTSSKVGPLNACCYPRHTFLICSHRRSTAFTQLWKQRSAVKHQWQRKTNIMRTHVDQEVALLTALQANRGRVKSFWGLFPQEASSILECKSPTNFRTGTLQRKSKTSWFIILLGYQR